MKTISLTRGKVALVDDDDYEWLRVWKWCASKIGHTFYAMRRTDVRNNQNTEYMHRLILGLKPGDKRQCDHIDGNGRNNQRSNLRICTATQNHQNQRNLRIHTSKYKGVYWHGQAHKWQSQIRVNKMLIYLGLFSSERDAAKAYDIAALKHYGEFAWLNNK